MLGLKRYSGMTFDDDLHFVEDDEVGDVADFLEVRILEQRGTMDQQNFHLHRFQSLQGSVKLESK